MLRILYFFFMPLVYELVYLGISHSKNWAENWKPEIVLFSFELVIDYVIEIIYLGITKSITGEWLLSPSYSDTYDMFGMYLFFSLCFVLVTWGAGCFWRFNDMMPIFHTFALITFFSFFLIIYTSYVHSEMDDKGFADAPYQQEDTTIFLHAMSDGHGTSGIIEGSSTFGTGYIHGKIETNYNLYYSFVDENEKVIIRSILYDENNVNIYEIGNEGEPRIVFHRYYKSYTCDKGDNLYSEYYIYDIYIPSVSGSFIIDME